MFQTIIPHLPPSSKASLKQMFSGSLGFIIVTSGIVTGELSTLNGSKIKVDKHKHATHLNGYNILQSLISQKFTNVQGSSI